MIRDTFRAIDHWMTNLFIVALQCSGIGLVAYVMFGRNGTLVCVGVWLFLTGLTAKKREEFPATKTKTTTNKIHRKGDRLPDFWFD